MKKLKDSVPILYRGFEAQMYIRTLLTLFVGCALVTALSAPASAQDESGNTGAEASSSAEASSEGEEGSKSGSNSAERSAERSADRTKTAAEKAAEAGGEADSGEASTEAAKKSADEEDEAAGSKPGDATPVGTVAVESPGADHSIYIEQNTNEETPSWRIGIGGYLRTRFSQIRDDPKVDQVGRHDGFLLGDARLSLDGRLSNGIGFVFEFDGAVAEPAALNSPVADVNMRLKDTFTYYQPFDELRVSVGQFKPPYDVEELTSNSELLFATQSVGSRGVQNVEGYNVEGLSLSREVGVRVDGEPYYPFASGDEESGFGVSGALALTNGQSANRSLNDNDRFAYYGRAALHWGTLVQLGGAYYVNDETRGERPDLVDVKRTGWTADLTVDVVGITAIGSVMSRKESPFQNADSAEGATTARAYQGQIAYEEPFIGLQPAYRLAYYDPEAKYEGSVDQDTPFRHARTYHTVGLNYNAKSYPVRVMVNYTIAQEEEKTRELKNNRLDALLQVSW